MHVFDFRIGDRSQKSQPFHRKSRDTSARPTYMPVPLVRKQPLRKTAWNLEGNEKFRRSSLESDDLNMLK